MRLVTKEELRLDLYIALKVAPKHLKGSNDQATDGLARLLVERIIGGQWLLVRPDYVPDSRGAFNGVRPGRWGETEPHPFPDLAE